MNIKPKTIKFSENFEINLLGKGNPISIKNVFRKKIMVDNETALGYKTLLEYAENFINNDTYDMVHFILKTAKLLKDGKLASKEYKKENSDVYYMYKHGFEENVVIINLMTKKKIAK